MQKMGNFEEKRKNLLHIVRLRKYKIRGEEVKRRSAGKDGYVKVA